MPTIENQHTPAENQPLPFYTESVLSYFRDTMPSGPFPHTNLSGTENRPTNRLSQREAEKAISLLMGFKQTPEWIKTEKGDIKNINNTPTIVLVNGTDNTCFDGDCYIKDTLKTGKSMIGLRVTPYGNSNSPSIPFIRFGNFNDPRLIKNNEENIVGFYWNKPRNGDKPSQHLFSKGDIVELFDDPRSIKRKMFNPNKKPDINGREHKEKIFLGGGFTLLLKNLKPDSKEIVTAVEATTNDVVIRDIDDPKNDPYKYRFEEYCLKVDSRKGLVPSQPSKFSSTSEVIKNGQLLPFIRHVIDSFVDENGKALKKMASIALELNPSEGLHAIKCHYATVKGDDGEPSIKTYAFNFESEESVEQWLTKNNKHDQPYQPNYFRYPKKKKLQQLINSRQATRKELTPKMRLNSDHAIIMGFISTNFATAIRYLELVDQLRKFQSESSLLQQEFKSILKNHGLQEYVPKAVESSLTQTTISLKPNDFIPWDLPSTSNHAITHEYSPARVLGTILAQLKNANADNNWGKTTHYSNSSGSVETIIPPNKKGKQFLNLDIAGFGYAVPIALHTKKYTVPKNFLATTSTFLDSVAIIEKLIKDWRLPITLTKAQIHSLREGD